MEHGFLSPDQSTSSSSRAPRPSSISVNVGSSPMTSSYPVHQSTSGRDRKRASHQVTSSPRDRENQEQSYALAPTFRDVYAHPAAVQYLAQHPKRTIPKFGPYLLLQTLGEGEFGKVKLGLHGQWGEEVAVKLIRRAGVDGTVRMSKVEREIEVLRNLRHPNIVHLYDVIETDKYIGIVLEYASGGELFDHILAHKYLKEKDACKLFAQLISGVWYIHNKKIVHRDLKLENLLLDRNRNVIITDFGFANRFEHRSDDLMQTSCGSPCYAAPELVISEGLYVGSAVDIWSCGVILYAMLAGYLPFDDDPDNPDGDNINLLYKYIISTPLTFPEYISEGARDLLSLMLVPDPKRRADLRTIMLHPWLEPYRYLFERSVKDLEAMAAEQHRQKRLQFQKQMIRNARDAHGGASEKNMRSQSAAIRTPKTGDGYDESFQIGSSLYDAKPSVSTMMKEAKLLSDTAKKAITAEITSNIDKTDRNDSLLTSLSRAQPVQQMPSVSPPLQREQAVSSDTRPLSSEFHDSSKSPSKRTPSRYDRATTSQNEDRAAMASGSDTVRSRKELRHTIQVEYSSDPVPETVDYSIAQSQPQDWTRDDSVPASTGSQLEQMIEISESMPSTPLDSTAVERQRSEAPPPTPEKDKSPYKPIPGAPTISVSPSTPVKPPTGKVAAQESAVHINGTSSSISQPLSTPRSVEDSPEQQGQVNYMPEKPTPRENGFHPQEASSPTASATTSLGSASSKKGNHTRGLSIDKLPFRRPGSLSGKDMLSVNHQSRRQAASESAPSSTYSNSMVSTISGTPSDLGASGGEEKDTVKAKNAKSKRRTISIVMDPIKNRTIKAIKSRSVTVEPKPSPSASREEVQTPVPPTPRPRKVSTPLVALPEIRPPVKPPLSASTSKAQKVMQWFRGGKQRVSSENSQPEVILPIEGDYSGSSSHAPPSSFQISTASESTSTVNRLDPPILTVTPASPESKGKLPNPLNWLQGRSVSGGPSVSLVRSGEQSPKSVAYDPALIRIHHGAVDVGTVASGSPPDLFRHVTQVLITMGVEIQKEAEFKYRCIRPKRRRDQNTGLGPGASSGLNAFNVSGSATLNGIDQRGLPISGSTNIIRNLLRRNSSRPSHGPAMPSDNEHTLSPGEFSPEPSVTLAGPSSSEPIYGDKSADQGDEVRFSVELTRIDRLDDTFSLDIRRLKGNLRSYKFLYDTLKARCNFQT